MKRLAMPIPSRADVEPLERFHADCRRRETALALSARAIHTLTDFGQGDRALALLARAIHTLTDFGQGDRALKALFAPGHRP